MPNRGKFSCLHASSLQVEIRAWTWFKPVCKTAMGSAEHEVLQLKGLQYTMWDIFAHHYHCMEMMLEQLFARAPNTVRQAVYKNTVCVSIKARTDKLENGYSLSVPEGGKPMSVSSGSEVLGPVDVPPCLSSPMTWGLYPLGPPAVVTPPSPDPLPPAQSSSSSQISPLGDWSVKPKQSRIRLGLRN